MSLEQQINDDIKAAMIAREKVKLESLRAVKAAILLAKTADGSDSVSDDEVLKILRKLVKQRKESAEIYLAQNRPELAENELAEAGYIEQYLPVQLTPEQLAGEIEKIIRQVGASSPADMGKVMGAATKQLAGRADGKMISQLVKEILSR